MIQRNLAIVMLATLTALSAAGCGAAPATPQATPAGDLAATPQSVLIEGRLEPVRYAELALSTSGSVSELLIQKGSPVDSGQVIARLQNADAQTLEQAQAGSSAQLADAYQSVRLARQKLDDFDISSQFSGMTAAEAARLTLEELNSARAAFAPYKGLSRKAIKTTYPWWSSVPVRTVIDTEEYSGLAKEYKKQLDDAWAKYRKAVQWLDLQSALESAQAQLAQAQQDYTSLQDSSLAENTAGARAALASAELRSPFAGTITNLDLKVGQFAASGQPVVTVADFSSWVVKTTDLTEIDVVNVKEGQPVSLTLDAIPGQSFNGQVLSIGQDYSEKQGDVVYEVTVLLADHHPAMRWGMTAKVNFGN